MVECGITNLATCIPQKFFEYLLKIVNAPIEILLGLIKDLLIEPVNIEIFKYYWLIIIYIISIFYSIYFLIAGFNFLIAGFDIARKEKAKLWLKNTILMILLIQASYYLYSLALEVSAILSAGIINLINEEFFLLTLDNIVNIGLELVFGIGYVATLSFTNILLAIRYILVAVGVIFFPIGIFLYFTPPLKSYGQLIINVLAIIIFLPFIFSLMLLGSSLLLEIPIYQNFKILIMISAFTLVNITMILLVIFAIIKSAFAVLHSDVGRAVKYIK